MKVCERCAKALARTQLAVAATGFELAYRTLQNVLLKPASILAASWICLYYFATSNLAQIRLVLKISWNAIIPSGVHWSRQSWRVQTYASDEFLCVDRLITLAEFKYKWSAKAMLCLRVSSTKNWSKFSCSAKIFVLVVWASQIMLSKTNARVGACLRFPISLFFYGRRLYSAPPRNYHINEDTLSSAGSAACRKYPPYPTRDKILATSLLRRFRLQKILFW